MTVLSFNLSILHCQSNVCLAAEKQNDNLLSFLWKSNSSSATKQNRSLLCFFSVKFQSDKSNHNGFEMQADFETILVISTPFYTDPQVSTDKFYNFCFV